MNTPPEALCEQLPAHPSSVGRARRLLRAGTAGDDLPEALVETAELLVSELVSNAVVHAGTRIAIRVNVTDATSIFVEVSDGSQHHPVARHYADTAGTGRGLRLLTEMSDDWGVSIEESGKTVWFRLSTTSERSTHHAVPGRETGHRPPRDDNVPVELRDAPLALHARWQEVAAALLREYLLVMMDDSNPDQELTRHAECSDAMALLAEAVPEPSAGAPGSPEPCVDVALQVPKDSVANFVTLDDTLDCAVRMAEMDQLLTTSTDPAARAFRRWVCREVREQADGRPATPWRGTSASASGQ